MTITPATMYWFTRLDGITGMCSTVTILGAIVLVFLSFPYYATANDTENAYAHKTLGGILKWLIPVWLFGVIGTLFIPTSKQMAMIYIVPQITESQVVKQDIPELYDLGVNALKDWLKKSQKGENNG